MNQRIANWFNKGRIAEALRGQKEYFIPDITYRDEHDLLLVTRTLIEWAGINNNKELAAKEFLKVFTTFVSQNDISKSLALIHAYKLVAKSCEDEIPLDHQTIQKMLISLIKNQAKLIAGDDNLRKHVLAVAEYIPELIKKTH